MKINQVEKLQEKLEKKPSRNKRLKMNVSGKSVFSLSKIINKKTRKRIK